MTTTEFTGNIQISYTEHNYGGGESSASGTVVFPAAQFPDGISVDYTGDYTSDIIPQMVKDIDAYLLDPASWIQNYIQAGADNWVKLRELEQALQENLSDARKHKEYATKYEQHTQVIRQQITALHKKLEQNED